MLDRHSEECLAGVYPDIARRWKLVAYDMFKIGYPIKATEGLRTEEHHAALWKIGRDFIDGQWVVVDQSKIVTDTEITTHFFGLGLDACFLGSDPYPKHDAIWIKYGEILKAHGFKWGGDFHSPVDRPHCQNQYGLKLYEIIKIYKLGGNKAVWDKIDHIRGIHENAKVFNSI